MNEGFKSLKVYILAYKLAMEIYFLTKSFPKEETYSLSDQIRRSSVQFVQILARDIEKENIPNTFPVK